jgi:hypothetical protein
MVDGFNTLSLLTTDTLFYTQGLKRLYFRFTLQQYAKYVKKGLSFPFPLNACLGAKS